MSVLNDGHRADNDAEERQSRAETVYPQRFKRNTDCFGEGHITTRPAERESYWEELVDISGFYRLAPRNLSCSCRIFSSIDSSGGGGALVRFFVPTAVSRVLGFRSPVFTCTRDVFGFPRSFGFGCGSGLGNVAFSDRLIRFSDGSAAITFTFMTSPTWTLRLASATY